MVQIEFLRPKSLEELFSMLRQYGKKGKVIAGGTDLMVRLKKEDRMPDYFIALDGIEGLRLVRQGETGIMIGAMTRVHALQTLPIVNERYPILYQALSQLGTPTIRRRATIGGNLCNAAPSADTAPPLMVMGAQLNLIGTEGERTLPIEDFFYGPRLTCLGDNEVLHSIHIPMQKRNIRGRYLKMTRSQGADLATVGVAVWLEMEAGSIKDAKIALGAVAPTPIRAIVAEDILRGEKPTPTLLEACAQAAVAASKPINDIRSSADYRKSLINTLVKRAISQAIDL
jgi:CO/xanthine dehydrogenase FAD-binding subunit